MCRNIRTLANFEPPATRDEIRASSLQFVRKLSGANKPSRANQELFDRAVDEVSEAAEKLVLGWVTAAPPRDRDVEIRKHVERSRLRFGREPKHTPIGPIRPKHSAPRREGRAERGQAATDRTRDRRRV
jgi:hypothetical protein